MTLASGQGYVGAIAADATTVYWTASSPGNALVKCAHEGCGGVPTELAALSEMGNGIALDATTAYLTLGYTGPSPSGMVVKCAVEGCGGHPTQIAGGSLLGGIAVDSTGVYWSSVGAGSGPAGVFGCSTGGCNGNATVLWACPQIPCAKSPDGVALDSTNVYWTNAYSNEGDPPPGEVVVCAKSGCGGNPSVLASAQNAPTSIAVDGARVYWINYGTGTTTDGSVMACALGGCGGSPTALASGLGAPYGLAVDGIDVYWLNHADGAVMKCAGSGCGGVPTELIAGQNAPDAIAVDATSVYWANGNGEIMKLTPK